MAVMRKCTLDYLLLAITLLAIACQPTLSTGESFKKRPIWKKPEPAPEPEPAPSVQECRGHIEKALKEFITHQSPAEETHPAPVAEALHSEGDATQEATSKEEPISDEDQESGEDHASAEADAQDTDEDTGEVESKEQADEAGDSKEDSQEAEGDKDESKEFQETSGDKDDDTEETESKEGEQDEDEDKSGETAEASGEDEKKDEGSEEDDDTAEADKDDTEEESGEVKEGEAEGTEEDEDETGEKDKTEEDEESAEAAAATGEDESDEAEEGKSGEKSEESKEGESVEAETGDEETVEDKGSEEDETAEKESAEDETAEKESGEDETAEKESGEDEATGEETAEKESGEDETAEKESEEGGEDKESAEAATAEDKESEEADTGEKESEGEATGEEESGEEKDEEKESGEGESVEEKKEESGETEEKEGESEEAAAGEDESAEEGESESEPAEGTEETEEEEEEEHEPFELRSRQHVEELLGLDDDSMESIIAAEKSVQNTLKELKKMYDQAVKPMELLYKFKDISNRFVGDSEIFSKPMILFIGPWSSGKSTMINYLLDIEDTRAAIKTGAEPQSNGFTVLMYGETEQTLDGIELAADWTFSTVQKFGQSFLDNLQGRKLPNNLLRKVTIVDTPGIIENRKQLDRTYPFNDACQWLIDRADIIYVVFDPTKLDMGLEMEALFDQLKGREAQVRVVLNKADSVSPQELMQVQSTLLWNLSPLLGSSEPPTIFVGTLWSRQYLPGAPGTLFDAQEAALLQDLRQTIDGRVENKISFTRRHAVRVRNHAKMVDCYLNTYYNHKTFFSNKKKVADEIIDNPQNYHIYEGLSTLTNVSRYDLPDPDIYRDFFKVNPLYDFKLLTSTCSYFKGCPLDKLDLAIAYDLPELMGKYRKQVGGSSVWKR